MTYFRRRFHRLALQSLLLPDPFRRLGEHQWPWLGIAAHWDKRTQEAGAHESHDYFFAGKCLERNTSLVLILSMLCLVCLVKCWETWRYCLKPCFCNYDYHNVLRRSILPLPNPLYASASVEQKYWNSPKTSSFLSLTKEDRNSVRQNCER